MYLFGFKGDKFVEFQSVRGHFELDLLFVRGIQNPAKSVVFGRIIFGNRTIDGLEFRVVR